MSDKRRRKLSISAAASLALALAACGQSRNTEQTGPQQQQGKLGLVADAGGLSIGGGGFGETGAPLDWAAQDSGPAPLPACAPMVQQANATYRTAPSYAYRPERVAYDDAPPSRDGYAYLATAGALAGVIGDAPPDYAFAYDGVEPWVWETGDRYMAYAEPIDSGYRYYYYAPGAAAPFLVRDPAYSYGYRNGAVAVIYDRAGRRLDFARAAMQRAAAAQYWRRAAALRRAYHDSPRFGVPARLWAARRGSIARDRGAWIAARRQQAAWRGWDAQHAHAMQARWGTEAAARRYAAARFDRWHADGYRGGAPRFYAEAQRDRRVQQAAQHERVLRAQSVAQRSDQVQRRIDGRRDAAARQAALSDRRQTAFANQQRAAIAGQQQQQRRFAAERPRIAARTAIEQQARQRQGVQRVAQQRQRQQQAMVAQRMQRRALEAQAGSRRAAIARDRVRTSARVSAPASAMRARQFQQVRPERMRERAMQDRAGAARASMGHERQAMMRANMMERRQAAAMRAGAMQRRAMAQGGARPRAFEPGMRASRPSGGPQHHGPGRMTMRERHER